jgi:hypothetical protein
MTVSVSERRLILEGEPEVNQPVHSLLRRV